MIHVGSNYPDYSWTAFKFIIKSRIQPTEEIPGLRDGRLEGAEEAAMPQQQSKDP